MAGVTVEGGDLAAALHALADDLSKAIPPRDAAASLLPQLQAVTPRDTGRLVSSLRVTVTADAVTVTTATPYAPYVHPWPVMDAFSPVQILNTYAAAVASAVNKIG